MNFNKTILKHFLGLFVFGVVFLTTSCIEDVVDDLEDSQEITLTADFSYSPEAPFIGDEITLNAFASFALNTTATPSYSWSLVSKPESSTVTINNSDEQLATFTPDIEGDYELNFEISVIEGSETISENISKNISVLRPDYLEIGGTIDENLTLTDYNENSDEIDYLVTSSLNVSAVLTIEPGVIIAFEDDLGLSIRTEGTLVAIGTTSERIIFTGEQETEGFWQGIELTSNNTSNELSYCTVAYGGSSGFDGANLLSNLIVDESGRIKLSNSRFENSAGYGIYTRTIDATLATFDNNVITGNDAPIMTRVNHYHYFDENSDYTNNDNDYIDSYWSNVTTSEDVTWAALNVPYRIASNIEYIESDIVISAGASFIAQPNSGIEIIDGGSLNAIGTSTNKITFSGEQDLAGYWKGIAFQSNDDDNELTHVDISNGGEEGFDGSNLKSNIMLEGNARVVITNTTSSKSGGYGLYTRTLEANLPEFGNNTFTDNVAPVMTRINHYAYFDEGSDYSGNDNDYIDSYWSNVDVTTNATWAAINVPYRIGPNVEQIDAAITIQEGTDFIGQPNSGLEITSNGSMNAQGSASNLITFKGEQDVTGYWKGLRFLSNNANNILDYITISNGGEEGFDGANRKANIEVGFSNGTLSISNSSLTKSGGNGIWIHEDASLTQSNLSFSDITGTDIFFD